MRGTLEEARRTGWAGGPAAAAPHASLPALLPPLPSIIAPEAKLGIAVGALFVSFFALAQVGGQPRQGSQLRLVAREQGCGTPVHV